MRKTREQIEYQLSIKKKPPTEQAAAAAPCE